MVVQTGCREPYHFVQNPPGQFGTKESIRGLWGTQKGSWGTIRRSKVDQTGPWKTIGDREGPYRTVGCYMAYQKSLGFEEFQNDPSVSEGFCGVLRCLRT